MSMKQVERQALGRILADGQQEEGSRSGSGSEQGQSKQKLQAGERDGEGSSPSRHELPETASINGTNDSELTETTHGENGGNLHVQSAGHHEVEEVVVQSALTDLATSIDAVYLSIFQIQVQTLRNPRKAAKADAS